MNPITSTQRRALRARAHALHPVVSIGQHGLTPAVLHEIDVALLAHELIKIRVWNDDRAARAALSERICAELGAAPVQHIGKLLVVWRPAPEPEPAAPAPARRGKTGAAKPAARAVRGAPPAGSARYAAGTRRDRARAPAGSARPGSRAPGAKGAPARGVPRHGVGAGTAADPTRRRRAALPRAAVPAAPGARPPRRRRTA